MAGIAFDRTQYSAPDYESKPGVVAPIAYGHHGLGDMATGAD